MDSAQENAAQVLRYLEEAFPGESVHSRYEDDRERWEYRVRLDDQPRLVCFTWEALLSPSHAIQGYLRQKGPGLVERVRAAKEEIVVRSNDIL